MCGWAEPFLASMVKDQGWVFLLWVAPEFPVARYSATHSGWGLSSSVVGKEQQS